MIDWICRVVIRRKTIRRAIEFTRILLMLYISVFFPFKKVISQFRNPEAFFYTSFSFIQMSGGNKEQSCTRLEMKQQSKYGRLNHHREEEKGVALHPHADTQDNSERHA